MLEELKIKCPNEACTELVLIDRMEYHLKECQFLLVKCDSSDCEEKFLRKDLPAHLVICKFKELQCERCFEKQKSREIDLEHDCIRTLYDKLKLTNLHLDLLTKKNESFQKEILELKNKTNF